MKRIADITVNKKRYLLEEDFFRWQIKRQTITFIFYYKNDHVKYNLKGKYVLVQLSEYLVFRIVHTDLFWKRTEKPGLEWSMGGEEDRYQRL